MREKRKLGKERSRQLNEMDTGKRENKTGGVTLIIASSGAVTSFIFTHYEGFCFYCRFQNLQQKTEHPSKVWFVCLINDSTQHRQ